MMARNIPLTRHQAKCTICRHPEREEIERAFVNWASPEQMATGFRVSQDAIYRHAHAVGLVTSRQQNVRRALERIIEHAADVKVNAYSVVAAVSAYARINAHGQWGHASVAYTTDRYRNLFSSLATYPR